MKIIEWWNMTWGKAPRAILIEDQMPTKYSITWEDGEFKGDVVLTPDPNGKFLFHTPYPPTNENIVLNADSNVWMDLWDRSRAPSEFDMRGLRAQFKPVYGFRYYWLRFKHWFSLRK